MSWNRCNKSNPCPICGKPDWCSFTNDGAVRCMRVEVPPQGWVINKKHYDGGTTYRPEGEEQFRAKYVKRRPVVEKPALDFMPMSMEFWGACSENQADELANDLGIEGGILLRLLGLGWSEQHQAYSFPMFATPYKCVGIRLRTKQGDKFAVKGSKNGIFLVDSTPVPDKVFVCEGPTDTAAMMQLGFQAMGRPSCSGGIDYLRSMLKGREVVIVSDHDSPGRAGANKLANELMYTNKSVKIIEPPRKDMRAWLNNGASAKAVDQLVDNAKEMGSAKKQIQGSTG